MPRASYNIEVDGTQVSEESQTKKPDNTAFKQQRLPAWQPILTPKSVFPAFIIISFIFIPIGVVLLLASNGVVETSVDYTHCPSNRSDSIPCSEVNETCYCVININVDQKMEKDVFVYFGLTNFFQNHRRYVKSRDDSQLIGEAVTNDSISQDCEPYRSNQNIAIAPCGAIANSLFNDTFSFANFSVSRTGIAWPSDHTVKFKNPSPENNLPLAFAGFSRPFSWNKPVYELDLSNPDNNGYKNEALEVWMRTAAFPTFRKLYGRLNTSLETGVYPVTIEYNYPVAGFSGTKRIILSTTSFMGGKNSFLGIAYIVVGALSFVVGIALVIVHFATRNQSRGD